MSAAYEVVASLMELRSERQPDVANTLGDVFSLELASRDSLGLEH
jgi:hypothetical protein